MIDFPNDRRYALSNIDEQSTGQFSYYPPTDTSSTDSTTVRSDIQGVISSDNTSPDDAQNVLSGDSSSILQKPVFDPTNPPLPQNKDWASPYYDFLQMTGDESSGVSSSSS